jgi:hypothetical protein
LGIIAASSESMPAVARQIGGISFMKSVRPAGPLQLGERPSLGTIMIRFVGLLVLAVVVLTWMWSR